MRRGNRRGGPPVRDLEDAAAGSDITRPHFTEDPVDRVVRDVYGSTVSSAFSGRIMARDLGPAPDTILDDYREDCQP